MFKKTLLFLSVALIWMAYPQITQALSDQCFPSVQCDEGQDYYAGSCQASVQSIENDCPAAPIGEFAAFSCDYGCYNRTRPDFELCAGGGDGGGGV